MITRTTGTEGMTGDQSLSSRTPWWVWLIDAALVVDAILMLTTGRTVLYFHVIFVLLAFGAFFWKLRGFTLRVLIWVGLTSIVVVRAVQTGQTQAEELIEIPLLISILVTVFLIASRRSAAQNQLEQQTEALRQLEDNLAKTNSLLEKRITELSSNASELTRRNNELEKLHRDVHRTAAHLEALAQVTRNITSIRDLQELLPVITTLISEKFDFYHVGIFLIDKSSEYALLIAANSEGGKKMLTRKHRLKVGEEGIVGYVADTGRPRIALDVGTDAVFFNNPDLPETHSEMGLPLISKNIIVGVLDVQSIQIAAFSDDDFKMLSLLADQVSLAIENAQLFDETRKALSESEQANRTSVREAWTKLPEQQQLHGYRYTVTGATPLREPIKLDGTASDEKKGRRIEAGQAIVPIELRGEVIGNLIVQLPSEGAWSADQLDLINAVAERVALSAENARLFEETTARAEREKTVSEITSKIRNQNDPQAMIQTAIRELQNALGVSRIEVVPQALNNAEKNNGKEVSS
jgi:GAF domain-containing protein